MRISARNPAQLLVWAFAGCLVVLPLVVAAAVGDFRLGSITMETLNVVGYLLVGPVYAVLGAVIVSRQASNAVGWVLLVVAAGTAISVVSDILVPREAPGSIGPGLAIILALASAAWVFFLFPIFHLLLTFPSGRLLSPGWGVAVLLETVMVAFMIVSAVFGTWLAPLEGSWSVENPIGFIPESVTGPVFEYVWGWLLLLLTITGLAAIAVRFWRSRGIERQQLKVFMFAVVFFALVYGSASLFSEWGTGLVLDLLIPLSLIGIGVAVAIAVLRYRLFEIDRVISRTVTYAAVIGLLALAFFGLAALVGSQVTEQPVFVAAVTLGVAASFNPLRRRIQSWVERRFNRSRYDAERVMSEFTKGLRERVDTDDLLEGWRAVVLQTMQPASIGVWMRP